MLLEVENVSVAAIDGFGNSGVQSLPVGHCTNRIAVFFMGSLKMEALARVLERLDDWAHLITRKDVVPIASRAQRLSLDVELKSWSILGAT
jgi:hypothetical protein